MVYLQVLVYPCHWMLSWCPQNQKCHLSPGCLCMKKLGSLHKGMGMGTVHVVRHAHYTQCSIRYFLGGPMIIIQWYHLEILFFFFIFKVFQSAGWSCSRSRWSVRQGCCHHLLNWMIVICILVWVEFMACFMVWLVLDWTKHVQCWKHGGFLVFFLAE